jgi:hypothetical protein
MMRKDQEVSHVKVFEQDGILNSGKLLYLAIEVISLHVL